MDLICRVCGKPGHPTGACTEPKFNQKTEIPESETSKKWEGLSGDDEIMSVVKPDTHYMGHSTASVDWLLEGKDLRVGSGGMGSLEITAINMPNKPKEFLSHLKMRVDPNIGYYHRGPYVVVLSVPPKMYNSRGFHPDSRRFDDEDSIADPYSPALMKNVDVIEQNGTHYSTPTKFILGYYDGDTNTFYRNPKWEEKPEPTHFGVKAEETMRLVSEKSYEPKTKSDKKPPFFDIDLDSVDGDEDDDGEWSDENIF